MRCKYFCKNFEPKNVGGVGGCMSGIVQYLKLVSLIMFIYVCTKTEVDTIIEERDTLWDRVTINPFHRW